MARKFLFALLGLLCLVPAYYAAPRSSSQESSEEDMTIKGLAERLKLFAITLEEFSSLYDDIVANGPEVFKKVLEDPNVVETKTETMESNTKLFKDYLDKFEQFQKDGKKTSVFDLVEEYNEIVDKFDSEQHDDLSPEAVTIEKSLDEHGLLDIEKSVNKHVEIFFEKFSAEVEKYVAGLNEKEKEKEKSFIEWYDKLKAEEDTEKKIDMFDTFFDED